MGLFTPRVHTKNINVVEGSLRITVVDMSDTEGDDAPAPTAAAPAGAGPMDINTAVQEILKISLIHDGLARGLRESVKALDKRQALLCVLANNCDEHGINLIKVDENKKLGEWTGLCKIDKEGNARKIVGCSCCVVKDWGKEGQAHDVLKEYFNSKKV